MIKTVPWHRRLVAGLSPRGVGFDTKSIHVTLVVDTVTLGQVFPEYSCLPLSVSCHLFPILSIIFILIF